MLLMKITLVSMIFKKQDKKFGVNFVVTLSCRWRVLVMRDRKIDISCRDIVY